MGFCFGVSGSLVGFVQTVSSLGRFWMYGRFVFGCYDESFPSRVGGDYPADASVTVEDCRELGGVDVDGHGLRRFGCDDADGGSGLELVVGAECQGGCDEWRDVSAGESASPCPAVLA